MKKKVTKKEVLDAVRPLRETILGSLTWEGDFKQPAPVEFHGYELSAGILVRRNCKVPYTVLYRAKLNGKTVVELSGSADHFAGVLARFDPPVVKEV